MTFNHFLVLSMSLSQSEIIQRITDLENEHRDLDEIIEVLIKSGEIDELKIKRLKKRKLLIKDMLICFENMLIPDIDA
jgi:hypothetical protein